MKPLDELSKFEILEIIESLILMSARKEMEIFELKAQLDIYKPREVDLKIFDNDEEKVSGSIMIVFRSKTIREILETMLVKVGNYKIIALEDFRDIVSGVNMNNPDICVFEVTKFLDMSHQIDTIKELRFTHKDLGTISVLPEHDLGLIRDVVTMGVDDFLIKPIDTRRLVCVINDILTKKKDKVAV